MKVPSGKYERGLGDLPPKHSSKPPLAQGGYMKRQHIMAPSMGGGMVSPGIVISDGGMPPLRPHWWG